MDLLFKVLFMSWRPRTHSGPRRPAVFSEKRALREWPGAAACRSASGHKLLSRPEETSADGPHSEDCLDEIAVSSGALCFQSV